MFDSETIKTNKLKITIFYDVLIQKFIVEVYSKIFDRKSVVSFEKLPNNLAPYLEFLLNEIKK